MYRGPLPPQMGCRKSRGPFTTQQQAGSLICRSSSATAPCLVLHLTAHSRGSISPPQAHARNADLAAVRLSRDVTRYHATSRSKCPRNVPDPRSARAAYDRSYGQLRSRQTFTRGEARKDIRVLTPSRLSTLRLSRRMQTNWKARSAGEYFRERHLPRNLDRKLDPAGPNAWSEVSTPAPGSRRR